MANEACIKRTDLFIWVRNKIICQHLSPFHANCRANNPPCRPFRPVPRSESDEGSAGGRNDKQSGDKIGLLNSLPSTRL